ncbi:MAG TPA: hypothetical protein VFL91_07815 [Thermomicrobiales bacterium]|nr:hypothetical protein [Thermomicrobiales bacterium]
MALEDYAEPEIGVAVVVTAAVLSPPVRRVLRRGAVYGLAGLMMAGDAVSSFAQGVGRGVQQAATATAGAVQGAASQVAAQASDTAAQASGAAAAADGGARTTGTRAGGRGAARPKADEEQKTAQEQPQ